VINDPDSYDAGYHQALLDVAKFIENIPIPEITNTAEMQDFWSLLRRADSTDVNKFSIFTAGYRVARKELGDKITRLTKYI